MDTQVTVLLQRARSGDATARDELIPLVYAELRRIASGRLQRENPGHTLQPTALVHEVFLRMFGSGAPPQLADRAHFLAVASQMMRRILVDHARAKSTEKRGGQMRRVDQEKTVVAMQGSDWEPVDFLELDRALDELAQEGSHLAQVIELHHFGGLTADETAVAMGRSVHAVRHDLRFAHAWLRRRLAS